MEGAVKENMILDATKAQELCKRLKSGYESTGSNSDPTRRLSTQSLRLGEDYS